MKHATMDLMVYDGFETHPVRAIAERGALLVSGVCPECARDYTDGKERYCTSDDCPSFQRSLKADEKTTPMLYMEQCEETDLDIFCWSVYGHIPQQGVYCIVDCPDENTANYIARLLTDEREVQRAKSWNKKNEERISSANNSGYR